MAAPQRFFDPFSQISLRHLLFPKGNLMPWAERPNSPDPPQESLKILKPKITETFPIRGQGTVSVHTEASDALHFRLFTNIASSPVLHFEIGAAQILLYSEGLDGRVEIPFQYLKPLDADTVDKGVSTKYWLSVDAGRGILRYGKYYTNKAMTLIESRLKTPNPETGVLEWDKPGQYAWLASLHKVEVCKDQSKDFLTTVIHPLPVMIDLSPFVVSEDKLTLLDIEIGTFTAPTNLPDACQKLFGNVAGQQILLNDENFPNFSDAIQRSCLTPGLWAYNKLQSKIGKFSEDIKGTYLRITLGSKLGDSPSIPYILEIWPPGHYSPIHDHGNSYAVIKVLHGEINCLWYNALDDPQGNVRIGKNRLCRGQITWFSPEMYQVHKLHNKYKTVCCTIQCYRHSDEDKNHYEEFSWKNEHGKVEKVIPTSDISFTAFRAIMKKEWESMMRPNAAA